MKPVWLTEEQIQLRDMLNRMLSDEDVTSAQLAELGIFGATLPEQYGGLGFGMVEATIISEALGKARNTAPFIESVVIAGGLIEQLGTDTQKQRWLPKIADGTLVVALALAEGMHFDPLRPQATSSPAGNGFRLDGRKAPVAHAPDAGLILITARSGDGISIHAVDPAQFTLSPYETLDGLSAATLDLDGVTIAADTLLGPAGGAGPALEDVLHKAWVAQAAEQAGMMAHLIEVTTDYLLQRQQFGVPLATFQVLRHRVADMMLAYEKAQSMVAKARMKDGEPLNESRRRAAIGAATMGLKGARFVGHEAIQLHGGMGVTEELSVGPTVRRIYALETRLGPIEAYVTRFAERTYNS
jgi:alkylation response protein AidB-like acyl-CoA dehydrogenase